MRASGEHGTIGRLRLIILAFAIVLLAADLGPALSFIRALFDGGLTPSLVDSDFVNYWMGAHLAQTGAQADLFTQSSYFLRLEEEFGPQRQIRAFSYPPHILLPLFPLGYLPYETAFALFLCLTLALFVAGAEIFRRAELPDADRLVVFAVLAAYATVNLGAGQNGFLTGALLLVGLAWRGRHPVLAGVAFGLLSVKPQLGLLIPLLLLIERDWMTILWSVVVTIALVALSAFTFGIEVWEAYLTVSIAEQSRVLTEWTGPFLHMMPTVFVAVRTLGLDSSIAGHAQLLVSLAVFVAVIWLFLRDRSRSRKAFGLLCGTFLFVPYGFNYDMGALAVVSAALLTGQGIVARQFVARAALALVAILPPFVLPLSLAGAPIAPILLAAAMWAILLITYRATADTG